MANSAYPSQDLVNAKHSYNLFDDFEWYISPHRWTSIVADGGSIVLTGGANGLITLTNDTAADNDEIYVHTTNAIFTVAAGKDLYGECRLTFTESNTDDANVAFGFASSVAADLIIDDGGGMRASGSVFAIYKTDGSTVWKVVSRNGSTAYTNTSTKTAGGGYQVLTLKITERLSTGFTVVPTVDGELLRDETTGQVIRHNVLYSGLSAMQMFVGQKNGSANNEAVTVDYMAACKAR